MESKDGLLLYCDNSGLITKVVYNNISGSDIHLENKLFIDLFVSDHSRKAPQFIVDIKRNSASFGCELTQKQSHNTMFCGGVLLDDSIIIFGSHYPIKFGKFLSEMMIINNEQTNTIRGLEKSKVQNNEPITNANSKLFDEISKLNNQLVGMQREIAKKNSELVGLNNLKNQFIGMAAHDLRNPLGFIINYCELLEEEKSSFSDDQNEFISQIKSLDNYMLNIVTDLLDVSSIESGKLILDLNMVNIIDLVGKIVNFNRLISEKKKIKLNYHSSIKSLEIEIDRVKIEQVMTNLINNAIKYSYPEKEIFINVSADDSNVFISVRDQGLGIEKNELNLLFKPFQKTSTKATGGENSTGLGLYIVKKIIEGHKGKIWVESIVCSGSIFNFSLPYKKIFNETM